MKKLSILTLLLLMATFAFANNNEPETNEAKDSIEANSIQEDYSEGTTFKWYGTKSGILKPCRGLAVTVCKEIIVSGEKGKAFVSDGEITIIVDTNQVNFEDGSVEM